MVCTFLKVSKNTIIKKIYRKFKQLIKEDNRGKDKKCSTIDIKAKFILMFLGFYLVFFHICVAKRELILFYSD